MHTPSHTYSHTRLHSLTYTEFTQLAAPQSHAPGQQLGNALNFGVGNTFAPRLVGSEALGIEGRRHRPSLPFFQTRQRAQAAPVLLAPGQNTLSVPLRALLWLRNKLWGVSALNTTSPAGCECPWPSLKPDMGKCSPPWLHAVPTATSSPPPPVPTVHKIQTPETPLQKD